MTRLSSFALSLLLVACAAAPAVQSESAASPFLSPTPAAATFESTPSPEPTAPSAPPPPSPTSVPEVEWSFLPPGGDVRVEVDALRLREEPGTESPIFTTLPKGSLIRMSGPPFLRAADGFQWRQVIVGGPSNPEEWRGGWVATQGDGTFLSLVPVDCPTGAVDLQTVIGMTELARLTCLGGEEVVLEGTIISGFGGYVVGTFEPEWLAHPFGFSGAIRSAACCFFYHQPPGSERTSGVDGDRLRLTGHFDDPAAQSCRMATDDPPIPEPDELAVVYCRERFVATSVEVVGD